MKRLITVAGFFLLASIPGYAQTFGLKFGYPTADALQISGSDPNVTYAVHAVAPKFGFTGELGLPAGFLVEIDALYSHLSYASTTIGADAAVRSATNINCWDFGLLAKRPLFGKTIRPFVNGGAAFRAVNQETDIIRRPPEYLHQATPGFAGGGGIDFKIGRFHLVPEFRYTQFQQDNFRSPSGNFHSNLTQPMFLLGVERGR